MQTSAQRRVYTLLRQNWDLNRIEWRASRALDMFQYVVGMVMVSRKAVN